jgi:hypothetical protein
MYSEDDGINFKSIETNEYLLVNNNYPFDLLWSGCRNNCLHFIKKIINNDIIEKYKNEITLIYKTSLLKNNIKISSLLFNESLDVVYKDMYLKCIINNSTKSLKFLKSKNIYMSDYNEEYIVSECLRIGNYKLAKKIIKLHNIDYSSLMYYIYVKRINLKMLIWLLNKITDKKMLKFINIFNYIDGNDFKKIFKIVGNQLLNINYFNKCCLLKKYTICKIMADNNFTNKQYNYTYNIKILNV